MVAHAQEALRYTLRLRESFHYTPWLLMLKKAVRYMLRLRESFLVLVTRKASALHVEVA